MDEPKKKGKLRVDDTKVTYDVTVELTEETIKLLEQRPPDGIHKNIEGIIRHVVADYIESKYRGNILTTIRSDGPPVKDSIPQELIGKPIDMLAHLKAAITDEELFVRIVKFEINYEEQHGLTDEDEVKRQFNYDLTTYRTHMQRMFGESYYKTPRVYIHDEILNSHLIHPVGYFRFILIVSQ